jgi:polyhydroxyalkanoate synthase
MNSTAAQDAITSFFSMYESVLDKTLNYQEKLIKGMELFRKLDYDEINKTPRDLVLQIDKLKLYHYKSIVKNPHPIPVLIVYALMNKPYIMDIQQDKSFVKKLLELGLDLYIIDWGYPTAADRFITMEDYVEGYLGDCVDYVRNAHNLPAINLLGKCQGGTFSSMYTSLHPEKIKNLVIVAAPFEFDIKEGLLFQWAKRMDVDLLIDAHGVLPGEFLNEVFIMLSPYNLSIGKYINIVNSFDDPKALGEFLRMEKWIFDCPDQAGENFRTWIKELWQQNKLIKGEFHLGGKRIDLKNITMPLLNVYGTKDNLIPPSASIPLNAATSSTDTESVSYPIGHAGIVASTLSQKEIAPKIAAWIKERKR